MSRSRRPHVIASLLVALGDRLHTGPHQPTTAPSSGCHTRHSSLDNGLDVVLHQDHSDPIVAVAMLYHVGSARETPGRTGFAHLFEHLLFQNLENVGPGGFINGIPALGGTFNGGTSNDSTIYYAVVPNGRARARALDGVPIGLASSSTR